MIRPGTCLFVYGSLMPTATGAQGHRQRKRLLRESRSLGPATVRGTLYNCVSYPGFIDCDDRGRKVFGEALLLSFPKATFSWLDSYEAPDYVRHERQVRLAGGQTRTAWVYVYLGLTKPSHSIASGRWRAQPSACPRS